MYKCSDPDLSVYLTAEDLESINNSISSLQTSVSNLDAAKLDVTAAENTYAKKAEIPSLDGYLTTTAADNKYATIATTNDLQEEVDDLSTTVSNKADLSVLSGYVTTTQLATKQDKIDDLATIRSGASLGATALQESDLDEVNESISDLNTALTGKQATISDLETIRSGAALGATAVQPSTLNNYVPTSRTINSKKLTENITLSASDVGAPTTDQFDDLQTTVNGKLDSSTASNTYATKTDLSDGLATKQATLVSGTNIKTIEGQSLLGSGDIQITASQVGAYTTDEVDTKVTSLTSSINSVSSQATTNKNAIATLNGAETTTGSVKAIAKSYADAAEADANAYADGITTNLNNQIAKHEEDVTAINNKFNSYATTTALTGVSNRVTAIEELIATDSDAVIDKWDEVVTFLDGIGVDNDLEALLAAKANQSALDATNTTIANLKTNQVAESGNLYFTNARAQAAITGGASTIASSNLTANRALISNASGKVAVSDITSTELGYLDGVTSNIQTQLNDKADSSVETTAANNAASISTLQGYFTSGKAKTASAADTATTATNLASAPSLAAGTSDSNKITVTAGGKTSSEFTVPYATSAGSASTATSATTASTCTGNAVTATALTTVSKGSATNPIY